MAGAAVCRWRTWTELGCVLGMCMHVPMRPHPRQNKLRVCEAGGQAVSGVRGVFSQPARVKGELDSALLSPLPALRPRFPLSFTDCSLFHPPEKGFPREASTLSLSCALPSGCSLCHKAVQHLGAQSVTLVSPARCWHPPGVPLMFVERQGNE